MDILSKARKQRSESHSPQVEDKAAQQRRYGVQNPQPMNMDRNVTLTQVEHFDKSQLKPVNKKIPRTEKAFRQLGIPRSQPRDMNRNVMLSQVEHFDKGQLKPLETPQRYILSPHDDVGNLYDNTVGMSAWGMERNLPGIRPVFKDENQRKAFSQQVEQGLGTETDKHRLSALQQLKSWSTQEAAMTDFKSINTKRQAPVVYVQGHGEYGDKNIYSNTDQRVSAGEVGQMLHEKGLPKLAEVRANSCYSGTEHELTSDMPDIYQHFKEQTMEFHHAGDWSNTFAGSLQESLRSKGGKNRVAGYMGPTGQGPEPVKTKVLGDSVQTRRGVATDIALHTGGIDPHKRGQMRRMDPSVKG